MDTIFSPMMGVTVGLALKKYCKLTYGVFIGEVSIKIIARGEEGANGKIDAGIIMKNCRVHYKIMRIKKDTL